MQGEPTITEAACAGRDGALHGECDTVEVLFAEELSTEGETHRDALEAEFDPCVVRTEPTDSGLVSSASTADVVVLADASNSGHENTDVDSLRAQNPDCRVLGVVENDSNVDLADSSLDEILVRPVSSADLVDGVSRLLRRRTYHQLVQEHLAIASKLAALEAVNATEELEANEQYTALSEELTVIEVKYAELFEEFDDADFDALMRGIDR